MFRRKTASLRATRHDQRLAALGRILDDEQFVLDGLSILASGEGFIVVGYTAVVQGFQSKLTERTLEVTKAMLDETFSRL